MEFNWCNEDKYLYKQIDLFWCIIQKKGTLEYLVYIEYLKGDHVLVQSKQTGDVCIIIKLYHWYFEILHSIDSISDIKLWY